MIDPILEYVFLTTIIKDISKLIILEYVSSL